MNEEHVYENKKYQSVVQSLKATFFDIVYQEENKLRSLQKSMEESSDNGEKEQLIGQISTHREKLDETMSLVDNLVHSIEELDLLTKNIVGFTSKEVVDKINDVKDENIKEAYQTDLDVATKNQEQLQNSIMSEVVENPTFDSVKQEIEQGVNDVVNGNGDATIDTNSVVEIQAPSVEENVIIPENNPQKMFEIIPVKEIILNELICTGKINSCTDIVKIPLVNITSIMLLITLFFTLLITTLLYSDKYE